MKRGESPERDRTTSSGDGRCRLGTMLLPNAGGGMAGLRDVRGVRHFQRVGCGAFSRAPWSACFRPLPSVLLICPIAATMSRKDNPPQSCSVNAAG